MTVRELIHSLSQMDPMAVVYLENINTGVCELPLEQVIEGDDGNVYLTI